MLGSGEGAGGFDMVGSKRQRLMDGGTYFASSPASLQASLAYGGPSIATILLGQPRPFPVVRLRGLPFNCIESDVFEFFAGLDVVDVLLVHKGGRFSGEAFVVFGAPMQVDFALQKNRQNMGRRYIEVFRSKKQDYYLAVAAEVGEPEKDDTAVPTGSQGKPPVDKENLEHTGVLKLRGLPFSTSKRDILEFFRDYNLTDENVHILTHSDGRATGEAFVEFADAAESKAAMCKDKMTIGRRYVELFPTTKDETSRVFFKSRKASN